MQQGVSRDFHFPLFDSIYFFPGEAFSNLPVLSPSFLRLSPLAVQHTVNPRKDAVPSQPPKCPQLATRSPQSHSVFCGHALNRSPRGWGHPPRNAVRCWDPRSFRISRSAGPEAAGPGGGCRAAGGGRAGGGRGRRPSAPACRGAAAAEPGERRGAGGAAVRCGARGRLWR